MLLIHNVSVVFLSVLSDQALAEQLQSLLLCVCAVLGIQSPDFSCYVV